MSRGVQCNNTLAAFWAATLLGFFFCGLVPASAQVAEPEQTGGPHATLRISSYHPVLVLELSSRLADSSSGSADERESWQRWLEESWAALGDDVALGLAPDLVEQLGLLRPAAVEALSRGMSQGRSGAGLSAGLTLTRALASAPGNGAALGALQRCAVSSVVQDLREQCALAAALTSPDATVAALVEQLKTTPLAAERAVMTLGVLLLEGSLPANVRQEAIERLIDQTKGLRKASLGERAVEPLARARVSGIEQLLAGLSKGLKNLPIKDDALRARALWLEDPEAVAVLIKAAQGRSLMNSTPDQRLSAGRTLLELEHEEGWGWAKRELRAAGSRPRFGARPTGETDDLRVPVIDLLARRGDPRAIPLLQGVPQKRKDPDEVEIWAALALLELGDTSRIHTVREYVEWFDWAFLAPRMALALDQAGDRSGVAALGQTYRRAIKQSGARIGSAVLSVLAGSFDEHMGDRKTVKARAWLLKHEIVAALEQLGGEDALELLIQIAGDEDPEVAASAALVLAGLRYEGMESVFSRSYRDSKTLFGDMILGLIAQRVAEHDPLAAARWLRQAATEDSERALAELWDPR